MGEALQRRICLPVSSIIMNHLPSYHSNEYPILLNLMFYFILIGPPKNGWNLLAWNKKNKTSTWTPTNPNLKKDGSAASPNLPDFGMAGFAKTAKLKKKTTTTTTGGHFPTSVSGQRDPKHWWPDSPPEYYRTMIDDLMWCVCLFFSGG